MSTVIVTSDYGETYVSVGSKVGFGEELLYALPARGLLPLLRWHSRRVLALRVHSHEREVLEKPYKEEGHLVVGKLLAETDTRAGVEG